MKKGWKIFWVVFGGMAAVGIICCIAALVMGVGIDEVTEQYYGPGVHEELSGVEALDIDVTGNLVVGTHDQDYVLVETDSSSNRWQVSCQMEGNTLKIRTKIRWAWVGNYDFGAIHVLIPEDITLREADIEIGAGKADITDLNVKDLELEVGAGQGILRGFKTDHLTVKCDVGNVQASGELNGDAKVECGVGDVHLEFDGQEKDFDYQVKCDVGQVTVGNSSYSGLGNKRRISNDADKTLDVDCGVGKVSVDFNK